MKKKVLTVTIVAAIVAALMLVLTGCPTPPPAPTDEVAPTVTGVDLGVASPTRYVKATVNATDNVGVVEVDATLTLGATEYATSITVTAATSVSVPLVFTNAPTITSGTAATVTAVAKDAAGNVSTEAEAVSTGLTF